jgi:hypothetical protein
MNMVKASSILRIALLLFLICFSRPQMTYYADVFTSYEDFYTTDIPATNQENFKYIYWMWTMGGSGYKDMRRGELWTAVTVNKMF